jgi:hypothetical protein
MYCFIDDYPGWLFDFDNRLYWTKNDKNNMTDGDCFILKNMKKIPLNIKNILEINIDICPIQDVLKQYIASL